MALSLKQTRVSKKADEVFALTGDARLQAIIDFAKEEIATRGHLPTGLWSMLNAWTEDEQQYRAFHAALAELRKSKVAPP